jgi:TolB-like protein/Tfp pilus assembly protein PilF
LRERLRSGVDIDDAIDIAIQVASALAAAHRVNVVHRDIKPENIMIRREDGLVKVLDFGLAKVTHRRASDASEDSKVSMATMADTAPGVVIGTVAYMSPEQARGETVDERTDIWSLGVVLYEMLAGCSPFMAGTSNEIISGILSKEATPSLSRHLQGAPDRLEVIVYKALAKNKDERYQTIKDLIVDLKRLFKTLQFTAVSKSSASPETSRVQSFSTKATAQDAPADTVSPSGYPASSAEYIVTQVKSHKRATLIVLALAFAVTVVAAAVLLRQSDESRAGAVPTGEIRTIAVLPLANLSGDASQEYFADGMTDELITELAKLGDVQVISRGSVMRFKNTTTPIPEIARQLGADAVLTGSVVRVGDRARVTVQLIRAATDRHLWAASYDRNLKDVLLLQREIALNVGQQVSARVAGQEPLAKLARQIDPAAYEAYLKGLYYSNKATPEGKTKALDYFKEATRISPFYPEAHANIAGCYLDLGGWYAVKDRDEALARARAAVTEALRQDDGIAEAHVVLGWLREEFEWDWSAAERELRRAVELNPSYAAAHLSLARHLVLVGRLDEVPAEVERARSADPLSLHDVGHGAWILEYSGHHREAVERMKTVVQMDPNIPVTQFQLGLVYMDGGELDKAADQFRNAIRMYPAFGKFKAHLAFVLARSGDQHQARKLLDELMQAKNIVSFDVGLVMAGLGDQERAIDWLEKAYQERSMEMVHLRLLATPHVYERPFYFLRSNPRFKELLRKMNFSEP